MSDESSIDPAALERLAEWGGEKLVVQMIRLFLENSQLRMEQIRTGVQDDDPDAAEQGAHSLKSSAANIGATELRRVATEMEQKACDADRDGLAALLPEIETAYASARAELEAIEKGTQA